MIRKTLLSLASIFLLYQSYKILTVIHKLEITSWAVVILVAWIINLLVTGVFAFAGFAFPTQRLLPASYYHIYSPKQLEKLYLALKVDTFRKLLLATVWKNKEQRKRFFDGKKTGISNLQEQSRKSEFGHLIPFIILILISVYLGTIGMIRLAIFCLLINIIGNLYPIILQRHHRMRIQRISDRTERNIARKS